MPKYRCMGFTLIELLVVIAIISLLVSILLPSLNKAKDLAREITCRSNIRNLYIPMLYYAEDNGNTLPIPYASSGNSIYHSWPVALAAMNDEIDSNLINKVMSTNTGFSQGTVSKFQCPQLAQRKLSGTTYAMNSRPNFSGDGTTGFSNGLKIETAMSPGRTVVLTDAAWYVSGWYGMQFYSTQEIGFYHKEGEVYTNANLYEQADGTTNMLLLDGHADTATRDDIGGDGAVFTVKAFPNG